ncbi:MAG: hypothetical protein ACF8NJ_08140 [Phycisphaerales bacterium JB038]
MEALRRYACPFCGAAVREPFSAAAGFRCDRCKTHFQVIVDPVQEAVVFIRPEVGRGVEPLGLPRGSIRALIALLLAATAWLLIFLGRDLPLDLFTLILTIIGYYFGYRTKAKDAGDRYLDPESVSERPLYLPSGTIRFILIVGFGLAALVLARRHGFELRQNVQFFLILAGLVLGHLFARFMGRIELTRLHTVIRHVKGVLGLLATLTLVVLFALGLDLHESIPPLAVTLLASVVSFYFGART